MSWICIVNRYERTHALMIGQASRLLKRMTRRVSEGLEFAVFTAIHPSGTRRVTSSVVFRLLAFVRHIGEIEANVNNRSIHEKPSEAVPRTGSSSRSVAKNLTQIQHVSQTKPSSVWHRDVRCRSFASPR
jgi:hypothetical protein